MDVAYDIGTAARRARWLIQMPTSKHEHFGP
jgi:hypothetical protein